MLWLEVLPFFANDAWPLSRILQATAMPSAMSTLSVGV